MQATNHRKRITMQTQKPRAGRPRMQEAKADPKEQDEETVSWHLFHLF